MFAGRTARLVVGNDGEDLLELTVEPGADIHRIQPKERPLALRCTASGAVR
ncbi:hypothetical protein ACFYNW_30310 [Streptomyces virginiae]|uniref:hypothetical protein n=1 Tax=Streptomyces virginiae TaxID=1961 RepID=UPI0033AE8F2C